MKASDLCYTIEPQFVPVRGRELVTCGQLQAASEGFCSVCASAWPHQALVFFKMLSAQLCCSTLSHKSSIVWPFSEEHIMCGGTNRGQALSAVHAKVLWAGLGLPGSGVLWTCSSWLKLVNESIKCCGFVQWGQAVTGT